MIVFGFGVAHPATKALAAVLDGQPGAVCFHEMNPSCMRFEGTLQPLLVARGEMGAILAGGDPRALILDRTRPDAVATFEKLVGLGRPPRLMGDVAHYHLRYVADLAAGDPTLRFVYADMDRDQAIRAWVWKASVRRWAARRVADYIHALLLRAPYYLTQNYWAAHDGTRWKPDPLWDNCFPKYACDRVEDCIGQFVDEYRARAEKLLADLGEGRILRVGAAGLYDGCDQRRVLDFLGVPADVGVPVDARGIPEARFVLEGPA